MSTATESGRNKTLGQLFTGYLPLAHKLAARYSRRWGIPYREVAEEAEHWLGLLVANWDNPESKLRYIRDRSAPTTWVQNNIAWKLLDFRERIQGDSRKNRPKTINLSTVLSDPEMDHGDNAKGKAIAAKGPSWIENVMAMLSGDAMTLVDTILHAAPDLLEDLLPPDWERREKKRQASISPEQNLYQYLAGRGWEGDRIVRAWKEVQAAV